MQAERFYSFNLLAIGVPALGCALPGINKVHAKEMDAWIHARQCTRLKPCTKTKSARSLVNDWHAVCCTQIKSRSVQHGALALVGQQLRGSLLLKWVRHTAAPGIHTSDARHTKPQRQHRRLKSLQEKFLCRQRTATLTALASWTRRPVWAGKAQKLRRAKFAS